MGRNSAVTREAVALASPKGQPRNDNVDPVIRGEAQLVVRETLPEAKRVACVSWTPALAETRSLMLAEAGYEVISLFGQADLEQLTNHVNSLDLLIVGHDVPVEEKRRALKLFKLRNKAPVLSLLNSYQSQDGVNLNSRIQECAK